MDIIISLISKQLNISERQIRNTLKLLADGATIPFISRYRKEATGGLDEVQITAIADANDKLTELVKRKETIVKTIAEQGALTDELRCKIDDTWEANVLEDLYLPYKPKRRTRGQMAIERGLEPLAKIIMAQRCNDLDLQAERYLNDQVPDVKEALAGARDIIAEWINENSFARNIVRRQFAREAVITARVAKGKEADGDKYRD